MMNTGRLHRKTHYPLNSSSSIPSIKIEFAKKNLLLFELYMNAAEASIATAIFDKTFLASSFWSRHFSCVCHCSSFAKLSPDCTPSLTATMQKKKKVIAYHVRGRLRMTELAIASLNEYTPCWGSSLAKLSREMLLLFLLPIFATTR